MDMQLDPIVSAKERYRTLFYRRLQELDCERRTKASEEARKKCIELALDARFVLSFSSLENEINLFELNKILANQGKLVLPRVYGNSLRVYHVKDIEHVEIGKWGIYEPSLSYCVEIEADKVDLAFIPGLGFDTQNNRLGRGKGYYDRFFQQYPGLITYGIAYHEQILSDEILPVEKADIKVSCVLGF